MLDLLPDLFDAYPNDLTLIPLPFYSYGGSALFHGEVITVKCFEDNSKVKELLNQDGKGKVLVVDGGGSLRRALLGDLIAESAVKNRWAGVIVYGGVRDVATLALLPLGVKALGAVPIKTQRKGIGEINVSIEIAGVSVVPGMYIYGDLNGIALSESELEIPRENG